MSELKIIENDLVPVYETSTGEKVVYGTELHEVLGVRSRYREWIERRFSDIDAIENEDFEAAEISAPSGQKQKEHIIKLDTAKEMAMLERNEIGKRVRKYFIAVEKKYEQGVVNRSQLSPQMQMFYAIADGQARMEIEQKRQAEQLNRLEQYQKAITTAMTGQAEEDFKHWVSRCLSAIAESPNYQYIGSREERHRAVRAESYERLNQKRPCRLNQRVESEKGRAAIAGASQKRINAINKLTIIESDKSLKPVYESVIREMMIAYCVEVA